MKPTELIYRAQRFLGDKKFNAEWEDFLNIAIKAVVSNIEPGIYRPSLERSSIVTTVTDENNISMPADFFKGMWRCDDDEKKSIKIYLTLDDLLEAFSGQVDDDNDVKGVCAVGNTFYYQGIPSTVEDLTLYYQTQPSVVVKGNDSDIDFMPDYLQIDVLSNHMAYQAWLDMGSVEGMTLRKGLYEQGLLELAKQNDYASRPIPTQGKKGFW